MGLGELVALAVAGAAVPPAIEEIASGVAVELGGAGKVEVGPLPARTSADGSFFFSMNRFRPERVQPGAVMPAKAQLVISTIFRLVFFSILANL